MAKYIYNGKMSEMDFSVHHKYSPKKILKFKVQKNFRTGINGNWCNAEGTIFRIIQ